VAGNIEHLQDKLAGDGFGTEAPDAATLDYKPTKSLVVIRIGQRGLLYLHR
jgi:hypothetical protein